MYPHYGLVRSNTVLLTVCIKTTNLLQIAILSPLKASLVINLINLT